VPSSIFNSEQRGGTRAIAVLLLGLSLYWTALELATGVGFARISRIQRRVETDLRAARSLRPTVDRDAVSVLLVGNSLLLKGVDRALLKDRLAPEYVTALLPIENTQYADWYFGFRRLFEEGARPSVLVLCLSTRQMISRSTDGEYFAHFLMLQHDLFAVKRESQLDNTLTSVYFFANHSEWLGNRAQIRNWLLQEVIPGVDRLASFFPAKPAPMLASNEVVSRVLPHLNALDQFCRQRGVRLVVVVPPTISEDASAEVKEAAARAGMPVLVPFRPGELSRREFSDALHLNPRGAARFTERLASDLRQTLKNLRFPADSPTSADVQRVARHSPSVQRRER
jgi:hypothetical protein